MATHLLPIYDHYWELSCFDGLDSAGVDVVGAACGIFENVMAALEVGLAVADHLGAVVQGYNIGALAPDKEKEQQREHQQPRHRIK